MKPKVCQCDRKRPFRKKRTTGLNMCPGCIAFHCDPMSMSRKFRAKVDRRRDAGLCPACGLPNKEVAERMERAAAALRARGKPKVVVCLYEGVKT